MKKILFTLLMLLCSSSLFAIDYFITEGNNLIFLNFISDTECEVAGDDYYQCIYEPLVIPSEIDFLGKKMTVTGIDRRAFYDCDNIEKIVLPNTLKIIKKEAFSGCTALTEINLPEGLTTIEKDAFAGTPIESISIPGSVTTINNIFDGCGKLTDIKLSEETTTIGSNAFFGLHIKSLVIPNSVTSIQSDACALCQDLEYLTIGKNVTEIGYNAFYMCSNLKSVQVLADVPPTCNNSFNQISADVVLMVPEASIEAYSKADGWKDFAKIEIFYTKQCATPTINVVEGKIQLECETVDATIHYEIKGSGEMPAGEFTFPDTYEVTAYATLKGTRPSESVTQIVHVPVPVQSPDAEVTEIYIYDDSHTDITLTTGDVVTLFIKDGVIRLENVPLNAHIGAYSIAGETLMTQVALEETIEIKLPRNGTYIIKVGEKAFKVKI